MSDVQDTTTNKPAPKQRALSPREEAMNAVAATRNADFTKETGIEIVGSVATIDPDIDPEAAEAEAERARLAAAANNNGDDTQLALQREQDEAAARERDEAAARAREEAEAATARASTSSLDPKAKIKLKVNGTEMEITGEEALRRLQKDAAGDAKLEEANRVMREAQALQQSVQEQQRAAAEAEEATRKGGNKDGVVVDPDVTKKFTSALFKGDEEAAAQAFNEAVSSAVIKAKSDNKERGTPATPVDPVAIAAQVRQQIAIDSALERSRESYPDLYADPDIEAVAATKINRLVQEGTPFVAALETVQGDMAKKFGWKPKVGTQQPAARTDRRDDKLARKESLDEPVGGPSVKSSTQEQPQASVTDTIREMAKARGQVL